MNAIFDFGLFSGSVFLFGFRITVLVIVLAPVLALILGLFALRCALGILRRQQSHSNPKGYAQKPSWT